MNSFKRSLAVSVSSAFLLAGVLTPALALAANNDDGTLKVYVEVDDNGNDNDSPSDFNVRVHGDDVSKSSFRGSSNGTTVYVDGWYSVSISDPDGYSPSYSNGCSGDMDRNDKETCRITLRDNYNNNDDDYYYPGYNYQSCGGCQQQYSYHQTCGGCQHNYQYGQPCGCQAPAQPVIIAKYVPGLPNTGFEPISTAALSLMLATLAVGLLFAFPYVRKTLATVLR